MKQFKKADYDVPTNWPKGTAMVPMLIVTGMNQSDRSVWFSAINAF